MNFIRKTKHKILLLIFLILVQVSCSKKELYIEVKTPTLEINQDFYEFLFNETNGELTVESNTEWTVTSSQSWCVAQKTENRVNFVLENNMNPYNRIAELQIKTSSGLKKTVRINQYGNVPTLIIDKNEFSLENKGGELIVNVRSNVEWTVNSDSPTWCHVTKEDGKVKITVDESKQTVPRQAVVLLRGNVVNAGNVIAEDRAIVIYQAGAVFGVDVTDVDVEIAGGNSELNVISPTEWNYVSTASWFTVVKEGNKIKLNVSANTGPERKGQITVTSGIYSSTINIKQAGLIGGDLDRHVLIKIYETMGGNSWTGTKWDITKPLTDATGWNGVTISNGRVTAIGLNRRGLTGRIPEEIGYLTEMTNLNLGNNAITGEIPSSIGSFSKILYLVLNNNQLTGNMPQTLGGLKLLRTLNLANNNLTGNFPAGFGTLTTLASLQVQNNRLTGTIPQDLKSHTNWNTFSGTVCPQQTTYGFTNCP